MDLVKPLLVLGSGGTLVTGAYFTSGYWMPSKEREIKSISDVLKGRKLISLTLSGTALTKQWEAEFESAETEIKGILGDSTLNKQKGGAALSSWCSDQMDLDSEKNKEVLVSVEKYCLIRSISNQLSRKGKNLLKLDNATGWSATYKKRQQDISNRGDVGLEGGTTWTGVNETNDLEKVKGWCSGNSGNDFLASEDEANSLYTKVLKWCTQEGE